MPPQTSVINAKPDSLHAIIPFFVLGFFGGVGFQLGMNLIRKSIAIFSSTPWRYLELNKLCFPFYKFNIHDETKLIEKESESEKSNHQRNNIDDNQRNQLRQQKSTEYTYDKPNNSDAAPFFDNLSSEQTEEKRGRSASMGNTSGFSTSENRYLELLVHNVAHTDLVLSLEDSTCGATADLCSSSNIYNDTISSCNGGGYSHFDSYKIDIDSVKNLQQMNLILCRPRFSAFSMFSNRILSTLQQNNYNNNNKLPIISLPRYERSNSPYYTLVTPRPSRQTSTPVGFHLSSSSAKTNNEKKHETNNFLKLDTSDLASLRIRGRDTAKIPELDKLMKSYQQSREEGRNANANQKLYEQLKTTQYLKNSKDDDEEISAANINDYNAQSQVDANNKMMNTFNSKFSDNETKYAFNAVFFPLLATLMTRWEDSIKQKYSLEKYSVKKVVVLVSGVGSPRNWTHSIDGNSTKACADLMEIYLNKLYPDVTVEKIHSETNIFRYDENIVFTKRELAPVIDSYRDAHSRSLPYPDEIKNRNGEIQHSYPYTKSHSFDPDWKKTFHVTLSFADGAPARTHAIQAALRTYRPTYFHMWQLKTFWHEKKITLDDVEAHDFEEMETAPALEIDKASENVQRVAEEMLKFKNEYLKKIYQDNDISSFWLRKTKKAVLAVLAVRDAENGKFVLYRGTNMEVSMPTGSLCAERNVIGTALATNPSLKRENFIMVAVLALPLMDTNNQVLSMKALDGTSVKNSALGSLDVMKRSQSMGSFSSIVEETNYSDENDDRIESIVSPSKEKQVHMETSNILTRDMNIPKLNMESEVSTPPTTPMRRIRIYANSEVNSNIGTNLYRHGETNTKDSVLLCKEIVRNKKSDRDFMRRRSKKRTLLVHSSADNNPLRPCGACNEWLKKIAESNPYFKVLTFTDADCRGVYVNSCQE